MITILTPSTGRPHAFNLCERYMRRQTYQGERQWLVAGEDHTGYNFTMGQTVIKTEQGELHSVCANYLAMLPHIRGSKILCVEDDDHYHETWLELMGGWLDLADLVGVAPAKYYHLPSRRYEVLYNHHWASLAATGFTREVLPYFEMGCKLGHPYIDGWLWCHWSQTMGKSSLLMDNDNYQIGIKGVEGPGVGTGHTRHLLHQDQEGKVLREWTGDAADWYVTRCSPSGPSAPCIG